MRNNLKKISLITLLLVLVCCIKEKPVIEKETGDMSYISKEEVYDDFMDKLSNYNVITKNHTNTIADSQNILYDHVKRTGMDLLGYFYIIPIFDEVNKEINSALIYTLKNNYRGELDIHEEIKGHMVVDKEYLSKLNSDDHFTLSWEFKKWENSGLNINEELTKKADELFGKTIITDNRTGESDTLEIQTKSYGNDYVNIEISIRYEITEFGHPQGGIVALSGDTRRRLFEDAMYDTFSSDAINLYFQDDYWGQEATFYMGYPEHMLDNLDQQVISLVRNIETEVETMANSRFEFFLINKHIVIDNINSNTGGSSGGGGLPPGAGENGNNGDSGTDETTKEPADLSYLHGDSSYYPERYKDAKSRLNECAPTYYIKYEKKYYKDFQLLKNRLSQAGKTWVDRTALALHIKISELLENNPEIENNNDEFQRAAFETHSTAYIEAGIIDLPMSDKINIFFTVDRVDLNKPGGMLQIVEVGVAQISHWSTNSSDMFNDAEYIYNNFDTILDDAIEWWYRDNLGTKSTQSDGIEALELLFGDQFRYLQDNVPGFSLPYRF